MCKIIWHTDMYVHNIILWPTMCECIYACIYYSVLLVWCVQNVLKWNLSWLQNDMQEWGTWKVQLRRGEVFRSWCVWLCVRLCACVCVHASCVCMYVHENEMHTVHTLTQTQRTPLMHMRSHIDMSLSLVCQSVLAMSVCLEHICLSRACLFCLRSCTEISLCIRIHTYISATGHLPCTYTSTLIRTYTHVKACIRRNAPAKVDTYQHTYVHAKHTFAEMRKCLVCPDGYACTSSDGQAASVKDAGSSVEGPDDAGSLEKVTKVMVIYTCMYVCMYLCEYMYVENTCAGI